MKRFLLISIAVFLFYSMNGQNVPKQWTLEECIRYAIANNITLKQWEQNEEIGRASCRERV